MVTSDDRTLGERGKTIAPIHADGKIPGNSNIALIDHTAGKPYWVGGMIYNIKLSGTDTGGAYSILEVTVPPGTGAPMHIHHKEDEAFYMLEGELEFAVGDRMIQAKTGDLLNGPRDIPHGFVNATAKVAKQLFFFYPAGVEQYFAEAGEPVADPSEPVPPLDMEKFIRLAPKYGLEIIGPPPTPSKK